MRTILLFLPLLGTLLNLHAQQQQPDPKPKKIHLGLSYAYNHTAMKTLSLSEQYTWNGNPSELRELTSEELDDLNLREEVTRSFQGVSLEVGMVILGNSESKWHIDGALLVGLASSRYKAWNNQIDTLALEIKSGFNLPVFGLQFTIARRFNPTWGVALIPHVGYSFGKQEKMKDNTYGHIENFEESRKCTYNYLYGRVNLEATCTVGNFTFGAGPGFYVFYNTNDYTINRKNPETGDTYQTEIKTRLISKSFLDGNLSVEWRIIPALSVAAMGALGNDVTARGSIRYCF
jgi:hypothetical protein